MSEEGHVACHSVAVQYKVPTQPIFFNYGSVFFFFAIIKPKYLTFGFI
jgi:hypothetical protein